MSDWKGAEDTARRKRRSREKRKTKGGETKGTAEKGREGEEEKCIGRRK